MTDHQLGDHLLPGIVASDLDTARLKTRILQREQDSGGRRLLLIHGNCSSSLFFQRFMLELPHDVYPIAIDLRGFGGSEVKPVDATRGLRDFSDDVVAALDALGLDEVDVFGWSMGGGVVQQLILDVPQRIRSATLQAPVSPFGYGGTKGADGQLCFPDGAGAGAGGANPRFVQLIAENDPDGTITEGAPEQASPRATFRGFFVAPAEPVADEDLWVASMLTTATGEGNYPGNSTRSQNWPGSAPGTTGVLNSMAPQYCRMNGIVDVDPKPPILWVHGDADLIVSDSAFLDLATLGSLGYVPDWPGAEVIPPQPMKAQMRAVLDDYQANGGHYTELALPGIGHSPHLEDQASVVQAVVSHIRAAQPST